VEALAKGEDRVKKLDLDTIVTVRSQHRPGMMGKLTTAIGVVGGIIGDIRTLRLAHDFSVRELNVESSDRDHFARILEAIRTIDGIEVLGVEERVFRKHEQGKIAVKARVPVKDVADLRDLYTPGVARVCEAIQLNPTLAYRYTAIPHTIAIVTNGTRVLGLGDIGPLASMPVMEGKAILYDVLAGIGAYPILLKTKDPKRFVDTVIEISTSFGGIHLEDIATPECFQIEKDLDEALDIPVMHDDQHGTACAALAALISGCRRIGVDLHDAVVGVLGQGAAGTAIAALMIRYGVKNVIVSDPKPAAMQHVVDQGGEAVSFDDVLARSEILIAATAKAGLIPPARIRKGSIVLSLTNPAPEITPDDAMAAGARLAADGAVINNALAFPGLFKGALRTHARSMTWEMKIAAAEAIASLAGEEIVPDVLDPKVHEAVTIAVADAAVRSGVAKS
jgi:malate dehydrogenase (oxaloacetate-decarboxylating)